MADVRQVKWEFGGAHGPEGLVWVWEADAHCIYPGNMLEGEAPEYEDTRLFEAPEALAKQLVEMHNALIDASHELTGAQHEAAAAKRERDVARAELEQSLAQLSEANARTEAAVVDAGRLREALEKAWTAALGKVKPAVLDDWQAALASDPAGVAAWLAGKKAEARRATLEEVKPLRDFVEAVAEYDEYTDDVETADSSAARDALAGVLSRYEERARKILRALAPTPAKELT